MKNGIFNGSTMSKRLSVADCSWVRGLHRAKQHSLLLTALPTHPVSFASPFWGRTRRLIPIPSSHPQVQGRGPGTAELLCPVPATPCSDHPEMLKEHGDAQKMPLHETCKVVHSVREAGMS